VLPPDSSLPPESVLGVAPSFSSRLSAGLFRKSTTRGWDAICLRSVHLVGIALH
jgi:hypothetical protein